MARNRNQGLPVVCIVASEPRGHHRQITPVAWNLAWASRIFVHVNSISFPLVSMYNPDCAMSTFTQPNAVSAASHMRHSCILPYYFSGFPLASRRKLSVLRIGMSNAGLGD